MRLARLFVSLYTGLSAIAFGVTLLRPVDTFAVGSHWDAMAQRGPEWAWGLAILIAGIFAVIAPAVRFHWLAHLPVFAGWLFIALMFLLGDNRSVGAATAAVDALFAGGLFMVALAEQLERWRTGSRHA